MADACTDRTAAVARAHGADVVEVSRRCVGAARQAGVRQVLRATCHADPAMVWMATTDADSRVPRWWLRRQLRFADQGWKGVLGTVTVGDWAEHPLRVQRLFAQRYRAWQVHHPHVHGANLGFAADVYLMVGGFRPPPTGEDHALIDDLVAAGIPLLRTTEIPVVTSARSSFSARSRSSTACRAARLPRRQRPNLRFASVTTHR